MTGLLDRRLLVFLGKGGVGKSTLTAATGRLLAARGKRVLCCEINVPSDPPVAPPAAAGPSMRAQARLPPALGLSSVPSEITEVQPNLFLCNIKPEAALHEYLLMKLRFERAVKKLLGNAPVRSFLRMVPSLSEVVMLGKLLHHVREQRGRSFRFDLVLLDSPATGHGVSLLGVPQALLRSLPAGPMRADLEWMQALVADPDKTAIHLVTLAEELPVSETLELNSALRDQLALPRGLCFANAIWPSRFDEGERRELEARTPPALFEAARRMQSRADVNRLQLARLRAGIDLPVIELPLVFDAADGASVTWGVQEQLEAALPQSRMAARVALP